MAYSVDSKSNNPANALRDALERAEREIVQLDGSHGGKNAETYLLLLDEIERYFEELDSDTLDLRPEQVRWDSLLSRLNSRPQPLAAAAAKAGGMAKLRAKHPPAESFWWHLDTEVRRRRLQTTRRVVTTLTIIFVVVIGGYWAINLIFPPNPEAVRMIETTAELEPLIIEGAWEDALALVEARQAELPNEPELPLWEIVFARQLGNEARMEAALARAKELLPDRLSDLWVQLGTLYLQIGDLDGADEAAAEAFALTPENPQVTFLLGNIAEARDDIPTAIAMFEETFDLAEDDNPQLAVIARVRMGNLLQRAPSLSLDQPLTDTAVLTATTPFTTP